jgi:hypothetical protein
MNADGSSKRWCVPLTLAFAAFHLEVTIKLAEIPVSQRRAATPRPNPQEWIDLYHTYIGQGSLIGWYFCLCITRAEDKHNQN